MDATAIKRQKLGGASAPAQHTGPLPQAVVDEYAAWTAGFKRSLDSHKDGGNAIDLGAFVAAAHGSVCGQMCSFGSISWLQACE